MPSVWKEVLLPGTQQGPDGKRYTFTRRDVLEARRNVNKMLSRGVPIPAVWEHVNVEAGDSDAWKARYAKYTFGHIDRSRINARGGLDLRHEIPDPADVQQLVKTKFVSPKVYPSYSDSRGGTYRGTTIAHVAATPSPVQFWQRPWELSQRGTLYLSYLPENAMPDEPADKDDKGDKGGQANAELSELIEALRAKGMPISDKVSSLRELTIAVESSSGPDDAGGDDDELDLDAGGGSDTTAPAGGAPMLMSTTDRDPGRRAQAISWAKSERSDMRERIRTAFQSGRATRHEAKALLRQAGAVEMSFTREGEAVCPLLKKLDDLEKKPANSAWQTNGNRGGVSLSATGVVDAPGKLAGDTSKGTEEARDLVLGLISGPPAKK